MASRNRSRIHTPTKRQMVWFGMGLASTVVASGGSVLLGVLNAAALALRPFTIVRTRLLIHWASDQTGASEIPQGVFTMGVVSDNASSAGIASIPTGISEPDGDFFVYEGMINDFTFITGTGIDASGGSQYVVDSKAQRKVGLNDDIVQAVELRSQGGAGINIEGRLLVKLH